MLASFGASKLLRQAHYYSSAKGQLYKRWRKLSFRPGQRQIWDELTLVYSLDDGKKKRVDAESRMEPCLSTSQHLIPPEGTFTSSPLHKFSLLSLVLRAPPPQPPLFIILACQREREKGRETLTRKAQSSPVLISWLSGNFYCYINDAACGGGGRRGGAAPEYFASGSFCLRIIPRALPRLEFSAVSSITEETARTRRGSDIIKSDNCVTAPRRRRI